MNDEKAKRKKEEYYTKTNLAAHINMVWRWRRLK
jgi:hypothetical protein